MYSLARRTVSIIEPVPPPPYDGPEKKSSATRIHPLMAFTFVAAVAETISVFAFYAIAPCGALRQQIL